MRSGSKQAQYLYQQDIENQRHTIKARLNPYPWTHAGYAEGLSNDASIPSVHHCFVISFNDDLKSWAYKCHILFA